MLIVRVASFQSCDTRTVTRLNSTPIRFLVTFLRCPHSASPAVCSLHRPKGAVRRLSAGHMLQSSLTRALSRKRPRVSADARSWLSVADSERRTGSSFKPSRRNDAGGEGSVKRERSTGVGDDQLIYCFILNGTLSRHFRP